MASDQGKLSVLARPGFRAENPYTRLLYTELRTHGVRVDDYALLRALSGRYDILHVHWPESTFNASLPEALATTQSLLFAIDTLRRRGSKLVWTAHNLNAHERRFPRAEASFWRAFSARVDGVIALTEPSLAAVKERFPKLAARPSFVIPHPHYRGVYPDGVARSQARARLGLPQNAAVVLFFGRILGYKNVPALIELVRSFPRLRDGREVVLLVAGKPYDAANREQVLRARGDASRVHLHLRFISDDDTQFFFRAADLVTLPYRDFLNSGAALLALGFDRPVFMPRRGAAPELARTLGSNWVALYDELTPDALELALLRASQLPPVSDGRHLSHLAPSSVARSTSSAYERLVMAETERVPARPLRRLLAR